MAEMKTLNGHEIVDAKARERLDALEKEGVGGGEGENLRIMITKVDGGTGVSSHTAQAIYEADVAERVIEAVMDGYRYEYLGATHFAASGECDEVTVYRTMVENGKVMTEVVKIFDDGTETSETAEINPYNKDEVDQMVSGLTAEKVGADSAGTAATKVSEHDTYTGSHNDIRLLIQGLSDRLNALANSDDTTLDDLKEIVSYIKANKSLIDSITTSKVSVADIIDNLTTNVSSRPLSAAQGVALKNLIDALGNSKLDASALNAAITQALAEAKASGEFKGDKGDPYTLTEDDKALIVAQVIESLGGNPIYGYIDENNNIVVQGTLADGTYSVKYEKDDGSTVNIGNLVLDSNVYYSITKNLTNCVIDNSATQVVAGGSYSATITASNGYTLDSVSVTMGGSAVSVSGGVINIASVTGDIVITAVASEAVVEPTFTNLADPTSSDWKESYRLSISSGSTSALAEHTVTNFIPCKAGDVLRVKGLKIVGSIGGDTDLADYAKIVMYNSSKTKLGGLYGSTDMGDNSNYGLNVTTDGDVSTLTVLFNNEGTQVAPSTCASIRIDGGLLSGYTKNDVIITINQEITD